MRELNEAAKSLFQKDPLTDGSPRWNMEAEYLRGYMTCWTIKKGARLVAAVAEAVSEYVIFTFGRLNSKIWK